MTFDKKMKRISDARSQAAISESQKIEEYPQSAISDSQSNQ